MAAVTSAKSTIEFLSMRPGRAMVKMRNLPAGKAPKHSFFFMKTDNEDFGAIYSLLLAAVTSGSTIYIKTVDPIVPTKWGEIQFVNLLASAPS